MRPVKALALSLATLIASASCLSGCASLLHRGPSGPHLFVVNALNQSVTVVEPRSGSIVKTIPLQSLSPHDITYLPKRGKVYVVNTGFQQLSVLDPLEQKLIRNVLTLPIKKTDHVPLAEGQACISCHANPVGAIPVNLTVSSDERLLYVANMHAHKISVIDTARDELVDVIPTEEEVLGLGIVGSEMWISNRKKGSVSVIDLPTKRTLATIPVGTMPGFVLPRPSHKEVYVCMTGEAKVLVFDTNTRTLKREILTKLGTRALAFNEPKGVGYAANYYSDSVTMFELSSGKELKTATFKLNPDDVALSADGKELYVTCTGTGELVVVDPLTLAERRRFKAGPYPADMALVP